VSAVSFGLPFVGAGPPFVPGTGVLVEARARLGTPTAILP